MPEPVLTPQELEALLQERSAALGSLPVQVPVPPKSQFEAPEPPPPPDPNDPHNQYMTAPPEPPPPPPAEEPAPAPVKAPEAPKQATDTERAPIAAPKPQDPRVVSTKPEWYKAIAPPKTSPVPGAIGGLGLGILGALLARKNPAVAATMGGLGGLSAMQSFADAPQREFDNRLHAAKEQASMHAKLNGGDGDSAAELARLELSQNKFAAQQKAEEEKRRVAAALEKLDSPETKAQQDAAIKQGMPEEQARSLTGAQLLKWRTGFQQQMGQDRGQTNAVKNYNMRQQGQVEAEGRAASEWDRRQEIETGKQIAKEDRAQEIKNQEADIPGLVRIGKVAPNNDAVNMARSINDAMGRAHQAASELMDLRGRLNQARVSGNFYKFFANDPEGKQALADAQFYQKILMDAQRELSKLGVLQGFEKAMIEETNPAAGSLQEYFTGQFNYNTYLRNMPKVASRRLKSYGYAFAPDSEYIDRNVPAHAEETKVLEDLTGSKDTMRGAANTAAQAGAQVVKNAADTAGQVADTLAPSAEKMSQALKKIQVFNVKSGQWVDAQKAEAEIQQTIESLKQRGMDPSKYIRMVP